MTRAMIKVAPSWRKVATTAAIVIGMASGARAHAFAPAQPVSPAAPVQPGSPSTPAASAAAQPGPVPQPGHPPAPVDQPGSPPGAGGQDYPPQYPPPPAPEYSQEPASAPQQGYPQQGYPQQYPQQGYPQQYPQQGYPQQYPQQGYPPQPYGQGYPPPGYYPQGYPPPPPPPSTRPHGHGALLLLPYLGVQANEGSTGQDQNAGFRMGGLIGYRSTGPFSFNGELTLDVLNLKNAPTGVDVTGAAVDLAFSPLFHFDAASLEMVVGPKIGVGATVVQAKDDVGTSQSSTTGFAYGVNLGAFLPLGNGASLGALISFEVRTVSQVCAKGYTGSETCADVSANSDKILGVTGAALF